MHRLKLVVLTSGLLFAAPAFAEEAEPVPPTEGEIPADPNAGGSTGGMEGTVTADAGATMGPWAKAVVNRKYVLPKGKIAVTGDIGVAKVSFTDPVTMMTVSSTGASMLLGGHYGVTDKITAGGSYGFALKDFEIKGPLTVYGALEIMHDAKMSLAATAAFTYNIAAEAASVAAGLGFRYNITDKIAAFTGAPLAPGPVGNHLKMSFASNGPMSFDVNGGAGMQVTPELFAYVATNLAHIKIANDANAFFGADFIPLTIGGNFAAMEKLDVRAFFTLPDLKNGVDLFAFGVGAAYGL